MIDIEKIKAAALAATQGEWKAVRSIPEEGFECFWLMHNDAHFGDLHGPQSGQQLADANYIATANPSAVLELIERLEAAERDAERYRWLKSGGKVVSIDHFKGHYRAVDVSVDLIMTDWLPSFDEAVDAGMEAMKEKP